MQDNLNKIAKEMADKISKEPRLKNRIMMGSDWPMFEAEFATAGEYYSRMFELCTMVTKYLKEKGELWDAWHQFSVINPLRFLGLLKDENGEDMTEKQEEKAEKMSLDMTKIEGHRDAIKKFLNYKDNSGKIDIVKVMELGYKYRIFDDITKILENTSGQHRLSGNFKILESINNNKIPKAKKILDPCNQNNLLRLKI